MLLKIHKITSIGTYFTETFSTRKFPMSLEEWYVNGHYSFGFLAIFKKIPFVAKYSTHQEGIVLWRQKLVDRKIMKRIDND